MEPRWPTLYDFPLRDPRLGRSYGEIWSSRDLRISVWYDTGVIVYALSGIFDLLRSPFLIASCKDLLSSLKLDMIYSEGHQDGPVSLPIVFSDPFLWFGCFCADTIATWSWVLCSFWAHDKLVPNLLRFMGDDWWYWISGSPSGVEFTWMRTSISWIFLSIRLFNPILLVAAFFLFYLIRFLLFLLFFFHRMSTATSIVP